MIILKQQKKVNLHNRSGLKFHQFEIGKRFLFESINLKLPIDCLKSNLIFAEISSEKIKKHFEETGAYPVAIDSPWNKPAIQMASDLFRSSSLFLENKYWWEAANALAH